MKKYKLHIIELDYHHDVLDTLIQLIDDSIFDLTCTTTRVIYDKLSQESKLKINQPNIFDGTNASLAVFIDGDYDVKIINTLASNFSFWKKHIDTRTIIRIHNINTWFQPGRSLTLKLNLYDIRKAVTYIVQHQLLKLEYIHLNKIKKQAQHFSFLSESTSHYFKATFPEIAHKNCFTIPTTWSTEAEQTFAVHSIFHITIPGTIESKRKDFNLIRSLVDTLNGQDGQFKITFAGKVTKQSEQFMKDLVLLAENHVEIVYFNAFVSVEQFDAIMQRTNLLFFPLVQKTRFKIFAEYYGKTKISGSENDFIKYGIPALINDFYPIESPLIYSYNEKNLQKQVIRSVEDIKKDAPQIVSYMKEHQYKFNFKTQRDQLTLRLKSFIENR